MQELPTNKPNFPLKHTQDFNQTTHVAPYGPIVFNDNISLYFNYSYYVSNLVERVTTGHVTVISTQFEMFSSFAVECTLKCHYAFFSIWLSQHRFHNSFSKTAIGRF